MDRKRPGAPTNPVLKLSLDFQATLDLGDAFSCITSMTRLMPFENGRAVAFGWGTGTGVDLQLPHRYWLAEVTRDGVSKRALPPELTHGSEGVMAPLDSNAYLQAFKFGEQFGVLLSSEALLLFTGVHEEPMRISIENHFSGLGVLAHPRHTADSHYRVEHCGSGTRHCVPVVFSAPTDQDAGRHLGLLEIDVPGCRARWLHTAVDGSPRTTRLDEYASFHRGDMPPGGIRFDEQNRLVHDLPPVITDCAWAGNQWYLYAAGFHPNLVRFGIPLGVLTRNFVDLGLLQVVARPQEPCYAHICSSVDRAIFSPLRANGPRKGKQTLLMFGDDEEHSIVLPRGHAKFQVLEYGAGHYWLAPRPWGYNQSPFPILACREA